MGLRLQHVSQRGGGKSFSRMGPSVSGEISFEQLTCDAIDVIEHARARLRKDRVFLLASSLRNRNFSFMTGSFRLWL